MKYFIYCIALFLNLVSFKSFSQSGTLDKSFGEMGVVLTNIGEVSNSIMKVQNDGRILIAGTSDSLFLVRFENNGTFDHSFGRNGILKIGLKGYGKLGNFFLQADGKILLIAFETFGGPFNPVFIKINTNGNLDSSYGLNGILSINNTFPETFSEQLSDGSILFGGTFYDAKSKDDFWLMKVDVNGNLDDSFGTNGEVITDIGKSEQDIFYKLAVQKDGKIVAIGSTKVSSEEGTDFVMVRYNSDGRIDLGFGENGFVLNDLSLIDRWADLCVQGDKKIVVAGNVNDDLRGKMSFIVSRFNENGTQDLNFGDDGIQIISFQSFTRDVANSVRLQNDGKILVSGTTGQVFLNNNFALARLNSDGTLDGEFGTNGKVSSVFSNNDISSCLSLDKNGYILLNGISSGKLAIAKYLSGLPIGLVKTEDSNFTFNIFPNPSSQFIHVKFDSKKSKEIEIMVYNELGQLLRKIVSEGNHLIKIDISDLPSGRYFLLLKGDEGHSSKVFIKE
jgi:uncharacterized delta-60 repeat protein